MNWMGYPSWWADFEGGPFDGGRQEVWAIPDRVAVGRRPDGTLRILGSPSTVPDGHSLYLLDDFDDERALYVYGDLAPARPYDQARELMPA